MSSRDYYSILGVDRSATADQIRAAHRRLARKLHPDVNKAPDAADRFKEIQDAYDVLGDEEKRKAYDRVGHDAFVRGYSPGSGAGPRPSPRGTYTWTNVAGEPGDADFSAEDIGSIFEDLFGGSFDRAQSPFGARARTRSAPKRGAELQAEIFIPFETAIHGGSRQVRVARGGAGQSIEVKIPKGVTDGTRMRVRGAGRPSDAAGPAGDLLLTIRVEPHPIFRREGLDILIDLPVTIVEAALGAAITTPTPHGKVDLKLPAATSSGARLRIRGKGVETADGKHGDFFAIVRIVAPTDLSPEDRAALERMEARLPNPRTGHNWQ